MIKKPLKILLTLLLMMSTPVLAENAKKVKTPLSAKQEKVLQTVYNVGKKIKANDDMTFEWAGVGVVFSESSAGKNLIGDESPDLMLRKASLGSMQIRLKTAKCIIRKDKFMNKHFAFLLKPNMEKRLISLLLSSVEFSAMMGITYLKLNYNYALKHGIEKPYFYAISKYNGGAHNVVYFTKVKKNIKRIKRWQGVKLI